MKRAVLLLMLASNPALSQVVDTHDLVIGESVSYQSAVLDQVRVANIYLPISYGENAAKRYPVIYLLDGSADEDFIHIVGLVQFGSFPWVAMIPESIVVGIGNIDRQHDFTFPSNDAADQADFPASGGSADFIEMLAKELRPLVARRYRTSGPATLIGQSLGGLLATEILLRRPALFDNYIIVSPSLWWDGGSLLDVELPDLSSVSSVYIGVGDEEAEMKTLAEKLSEKLLNAEFAQPTVSFRYFPELDHGDALHLVAYDGFKTIFSNR